MDSSGYPHQYRQKVNNTGAVIRLLLFPFSYRNLTFPCIGAKKEQPLAAPFAYQSVMTVTAASPTH